MSRIKETWEKMKADHEERRKNPIREDLKEKPKLLVLPRWLHFKKERGYLDYIAIGAASALIYRRLEYFSTVINFGLFKKAFKKYPGSFMPVMTKREAKLILNLPESATAKEIRQAHIKLMLLNHPDSGGSTYLASKINEAKDMLSSEVEEEKKDSTDLHDDDNSDILEEIQEMPGEKESDRFLLSILYGFKEDYTDQEIEDIKKKLKEIREREEAEEKANPKNSHYEFRKYKIEDSPLYEEPGKYVDKNSEFYQKYKDKIENGDYLDPFDDMNTTRSRLTNKDDAFKI